MRTEARPSAGQCACYPAWMATDPKPVDPSVLSASVPALDAIGSVVTTGTFAGWSLKVGSDGDWLAVGPAPANLWDPPIDSLDTADLDAVFDGGRLSVRGAFLQASGAEPATNKPAAQGASLSVVVIPAEDAGEPAVARTFVSVKPTLLQEVLFPHWTRNVQTGNRARAWLPLELGGQAIDVYFVAEGMAAPYLVLETSGPKAREVQQNFFPVLRKFFTYLLGVPLGGPSVLTWMDAEGRPGSAEFLPGDSVDPGIYRPIPCGGVEWQLACEAVEEKCDLSKALEPRKISALCDRYARYHPLGVTVEYLLRFPSAPVEMRGAILSVALESLTDHLEKEGLVACPNQLADDAWKPVLGAMTTAVEEHCKDPVARSVILQRCKDLNRPSNSQKLTKPFEALGVPLDKDSKAAIDRRNKLLHQGRLLDTDPAKRGAEDWKQAYAVEMRIYNAVNQLLLKYLGYAGPVTVWNADPHEPPSYLRL